MSITEKLLLHPEVQPKIEQMKDDAGNFERRRFRRTRGRPVIVDRYADLITIAWMDSSTEADSMRAVKFHYRHEEDDVSGQLTQRGNKVRMDHTEEVRDFPAALEHITQLPGMCMNKIVAIVNRLPPPHLQG